MLNHDLSMLFFLQLAVFLAAVRLVGLLARRVGQPQVVGEMIAGVLLGPSLFGLLLPVWQARLFPAASLPIIYVLSRVGLVLYMFLIGLEFNLDLIRTRLNAAVAISWAGIAAPFLLGSLLSLLMVRQGTLFAPQVHWWEAALFTGVVLSVTAFPMLARIIFEKGLAGTTLGTLALAAGALDDAAAWGLLAVVLASFGHNAMTAVTAIGGGLLFALVILFVVRPGLARLVATHEQQGQLSGATLGFFLMLLMLAAWFTDRIGIYAEFGAFMLGVAVPRGFVAAALQQRIEPLATNFLLPLFFIYAGLNTRLGLVDNAALWGITLLVILGATLGKTVACWAAARRSGESQRDALAIGALMNARGLLALVPLNIGLQQGLITPALFAILTTMAIVTTVVASPLFEWVYRRFPDPARPPAPTLLGEPPLEA